MKKVFSNKLRKGDKVMVVAPSYTFKKVNDEMKKLALKRFKEMGLEVVFGKHLEEKDEFESSSIESRIEDLHEAFRNKEIKGIITSSGGYNSDFLLKYLDWELIRKNPKLFIGMSDITVLSNAILAKTGLVTYSGPGFRNFGQELYFDYTWEYFKKVVFDFDAFRISPSEKWSDDKWIKDQKKRKLIKNKGWLVIKEGEFEGEIVGGNLCSLNLLQGTEYMPAIKNKVLFIEDDSMSTVGEFSRNFQSLALLPGFETVKGLVLGRFQKKTKMKDRLLVKMMEDILGKNSFPIIAGIDFGHTDPKITFPVGGSAFVKVKKGESQIEITTH